MTASLYVSVLARVLMGLAMPAAARADASLCAPVAAGLLAGKADQTDSLYDSLAKVLAPAPLPADHTDLRAALLDMHPTLALTAALSQMIGQTPAENLSNDLFFVWLDPGRAGAIAFERGHMDCVSLLFFRVANGHADIAQPRQVKSDAMGCASYNPALSRIDGTPSLMLVGNSPRVEGPAYETVTVVPWTGMNWGRACTISARFANPLTAEPGRCAAGIDCSALQQAVTTAFNAPAGLMPHSVELLPQTLQSLARNTRDLANVPDFGTHPGLAGPPSGDIANIQAFLVEYGGSKMVAVWGGNNAPVVIWAPAADALRPIGLFPLSNTRGRVLALTVN